MQKKNKLMLAAAIGMVAIVVATTAVRCSIAHTASEARPAPTRRGRGARTARRAGGPGGRATEAGEADEAAAVAGGLRGSAWVAADGSGKTLAFRDGTFVESDGASARSPRSRSRGGVFRAPSAGST